MGRGRERRRGGELVGGVRLLTSFFLDQNPFFFQPIIKTDLFSLFFFFFFFLKSFKTSFVNLLFPIPLSLPRRR